MPRSHDDEDHGYDVRTEARLRKLISEAFVNAMAEVGIHKDDTVELRKDLIHLRRWRVAMDSARSQFTKSTVVVLVTGMVAAIALLIKDLFFTKF